MSTHVDLIDPAEVEPKPGEEDGLGCLQTERGNLPLESIDVRTSITGLASQIEVTQGFLNAYADPLEATYIFPLPPRAAVTAMRMEADGRVVEGVLKERGEARASYDQAITQGKRASIAEEERSGVFTMRVGNIQPGERVTVHLTLSGALSYEDGEATFRFPLVVAPRYIPGSPLDDWQAGDGTALDTDAVPDASRITPPVLLPGFPNPVRLSMEIDVDPAGLPLTGVATSLHVTATEETSAGMRIRLDPGERADRDFLLRLKVGDAEAVTSSLAVLADEDGQGGTFALTVLPPVAETPRQGRDVVLVLDRSGSMGGWKMVAARRAAARIVDTLGAGDRLAVLAFDYTTTTPPGLPDRLEEANDRNRFRAVEFLAGLEARGGTEMLSPLRRAAGLLRENTGRARVLVLVTDGQVGNEDQILGELAPALSGVRVHTVGIDRAVNEGFLRRLAGSTGRCELVESEDRLDAAMHNIHRRIGTPLVTDLAVAPTGLTIDQASIAPTPVPDLYAGAPVVVTGRYMTASNPTSDTKPNPGVTISGQPSWQTTVTARPSGNPALAALWARARVRDLEDRYVVNPSDSTNLEQQIVETSLRFGVLCRFTAFVAVDQRVVNEGGTQHRVTQPVDLPSGWEMPTVGGAPGSAYGASPGYAPAARQGMAAPAGMPTFGASRAHFAQQQGSHTYGGGQGFGSTQSYEGVQGYGGAQSFGDAESYGAASPGYAPDYEGTTAYDGTTGQQGSANYGGTADYGTPTDRGSSTDYGSTTDFGPAGQQGSANYGSRADYETSADYGNPASQQDPAAYGSTPDYGPPADHPSTADFGSPAGQHGSAKRGIPQQPPVFPPGHGAPPTTPRPGTTPAPGIPPATPPGATPPTTTPFPGTTRPGATPPSTAPPPSTTPPPGTTPPGTSPPGATPPGSAPPSTTPPGVPSTTPPVGISPVTPGQPPVTQPPLPIETKTLATFLGEELHYLHVNASRDVWLRATLLAQLAERIRTLLDTWRQSNEPEDARTTLGTLSTELATPTTDPTEVDRRWQRAVSTFETLIGAGPRRRGAFWKR